MTWYINGVYDTSYGVPPTLVNSEDLVFGHFWNRWYNGFLDQVAIYNRALTPEEIRKMYEASPLSSSCVYTCNDNRYCNPKSPDNPATPGVTETACCSTAYCQDQTCIYLDIKVIPAVNYYYRTISTIEAAKSDFSEYKTGKTICLPPVEMREK